MHLLLHKLMLEALCLVPGGYLVRAQDGELRYMVAFSCPAAAVEWCLVMQEAALYLPYPQQLLQYRGVAAVHDGSGRLVFRGPRLKMGLFEGAPKCITPDYQVSDADAMSSCCMYDAFVCCFQHHSRRNLAMP